MGHDARKPSSGTRRKPTGNLDQEFVVWSDASPVPVGVHFRQRFDGDAFSASNGLHRFRGLDTVEDDPQCATGANQFATCGSFTGAMPTA